MGAGVGMDNIDVEYAIDQGLYVINTPAASSKFVVCRCSICLFVWYGLILHQSNREMPLEGDSRFKDLKKAYSSEQNFVEKPLELSGFGRIGQEVAKIALGLGMKVIANDAFSEGAPIMIEFFDGQQVTIYIETCDFNELLNKSDFYYTACCSCARQICDWRGEPQKMKPV